MYKKIQQYLFNNSIDIKDVIDLFELRDDGKGPYIDKWDIPGIKKPSDYILGKIVIDTKVNYKQDRKLSYPPIDEQLDLIYHKGIDVWRSEIKLIKDKYPKPIKD